VVFTLGVLVLLWVTFLGRRLDRLAVIVLGFAAFAPGQAYGYAVYPLSMLSFFTLAYVWLVGRERWLAAGLAGWLLVLVYPDGIAAPVAAGVYVLIAYRAVPWRDRLRDIALAVLPAALSFGLLLLEFQRSVGHWNAYFLIQRKYRHHFGDPLAPVFHAFHVLFSGTSGLHFVIYLQTVLVTAVVASVLLAALLRHRTIGHVDLLLALWTLIAWFVPQSTTGLVRWRQEATLLPVALLVGRLPPRLAIGFVAAAVVLSVPMTLLFVRHSLG